MNEKQNKKGLMFHQRHPWFPLGISLVALFAATINLIISFIS